LAFGHGIGGVTALVVAGAEADGQAANGKKKEFFEHIKMVFLRERKTKRKVCNPQAFGRVYFQPSKPNVLTFMEESPEPRNGPKDPGTISEAFSNPWQTLTSTEVYRNPWIQVVEHRVIRPDGKPGIYGVVAFQNLAVGVLALNEEGFMVLVGQWRYPLGGYSWEIPEGGCPLGQDPLETAQRELREETGYEAAQWRHLGTIHPTIGYADERIEIYLAQQLSALGTNELDEGEFLEVMTLTLDEALEEVRAGRLTDGKTLSALLWAEKILTGAWS